MNKPLVATAAIFALGAPLALADTTWISPASGSWATAANWNNGLPTTGPQLAIFADGSVQHTVDVGAIAQNTVGIRFDLLAGGSGFTIVRDANPGMINLRAGGTVNGMINNDDNTQTFNIPFVLFGNTGFSGSSASQTWNAAAGNLVISGAYGAGGGTDTTLNNNGGRLTIDGAFNTTIGISTGRGDISGSGGLTKNGSGTLTLGGTIANSFSGVTILNSGNLTLAKVNALQSTAGVLMNAGNLVPGNFTNSIGGTLAVAGGSSITFSGAGGLNFANSSGTNWSAGLQIFGWTVGGTDILRFGTSAAGLTSAQLADISFPDLPSQFAQIDANGFVTPIPEPSVVILSVVGGFGLAAGYIYRRRRV
jgi:autotransporter-associated beta strand protein